MEGNVIKLNCIHLYVFHIFRYLLIENFIPPEEKNKIMNRLHFDSEEDQWRLQPVLPERSVDSFPHYLHVTPFLYLLLFF